MEKNGNDGSKSTGDVEEQGESSAAKRIKCSIVEAAFCCDRCTKLLRPPIFQCPEGHLFCSPCRDEQLPEEKCTFGGSAVQCTAGTLARSLGMERAVESILVDCQYAEHGCTETMTATAYCYPDNYHWLVCPHAPCRCPEPGCDFAGKAAELPAHLAAAAGRHRWPSTAFRYWVPFDLRIGEPGTHLLRCTNDGRLFLVSVQPAAEPPGLAVSLVSVDYLASPAPFACSVSFSYSARHRGTYTSELRPLRFYHSWPPTDYVCVVPNKVSGGPDDGDAGIVLTVNISCIGAVDEEDDLDDSNYIESDEDEDDD